MFRGSNEECQDPESIALGWSWQAVRWKTRCRVGDPAEREELQNRGVPSITIVGIEEQAQGDCVGGGLTRVAGTNAGEPVYLLIRLGPSLFDQSGSCLRESWPTWQ